MKKGHLFSILVSGIILSIILLPVVNAQWGWYGIPAPEHWLDNPWFVFVILFAVFFGTIYISLGRVFKGNVAPVAVISAALSFFISAGVQRDWQFLQRPIMFWALILIGVLVVLTFLRALALGPLGSTGLILVIIGSWPYIKNSLSIGSISAMPYGLVSFLDSVSPFFVGLFILGIVLFIWAIIAGIATGRITQRR